MSTLPTQIHITKHAHTQKQPNNTQNPIQNVQHNAKPTADTYYDFIKAITLQKQDTTVRIETQQVKNQMRNRLIKLLLLPLALFLWIIGWTIMWAGTRKEQEIRPKTAKKEQDYITIMPLLPQEQEQREAVATE